MKRIEALLELNRLATICEACTKIKKGSYTDSRAADREICSTCPTDLDYRRLGVAFDDQVRRSRKGRNIPVCENPPGLNRPIDVRNPRKAQPLNGMTKEEYMALKEQKIPDKQIAKTRGFKHKTLTYYKAKWGLIGVYDGK